MRFLPKKTIRIAITAGLLGAAVVAGALPAAATPAAATTTTVTVHADQTLARVSTGIGVNDIDFDPNMHAAGTANLLRADGFQLRSLDSGAWSDTYRWQSNTYDPDPLTAGFTVTPNNFESYMDEVKASGAGAMIHVNYGTTATDGPGGSDIGPQEAAAWVHQANVLDHDNIKYWIIGEETYGNGFYSGVGIPAWEPDHHADKSPTAYGDNVRRFAAAMKAVDPSIKIGVEVSPYQLAGQNTSGKSIPDWNDPLLAAAGNAVDFVDLHWYPRSQGRADAAMFGSTSQIGPAMASLRAEINADNGAHASQVTIVVGETNVAGQQPDHQSVSTFNALYSADEVTSLLEQGASNVDWFATHNWIQPDALGGADDPAGTGYGDYGMLAAGTDACGPNAVGTQVCEPPVNTPFPAYYGLQLAGRLDAPGARLVDTTSTDTVINTHAAVQPNGDLVVLVENQDPNTAHQVRLNYPGYQAFPLATEYSYGQRSAAISRQLGTAEHLTLPPYSMTELVLHRS
ncbi:MAG TPA: hypothetical protein VHX38_00950 [Pseudonocardiaceae bacterium]|jgi:hypothetical protein|nr:hypothetical protein [Pseudonocardiaceae bacterium]